jgi:hypothetical protein
VIGFLHAANALAPAASTGNNTHPGVRLSPAADKVCANLVIEAVGATPTITAKLQGSLDPDAVADGSANWFDLWATPAGANTEAATQVQTVVGAWPVSVNASVKFARRIRLVTSLNTSVTYLADLDQMFAH